MGVLFHKYEGLGNDFVLLDAEREDVVSSELARAMCEDGSLVDASTAPSTM